MTNKTILVVLYYNHDFFFFSPFSGLMDIYYTFIILYTLICFQTFL